MLTEDILNMCKISYIQTTKNSISLNNNTSIKLLHPTITDLKGKSLNTLFVDNFECIDDRHNLLREFKLLSHYYNTSVIVESP